MRKLLLLIGAIVCLTSCDIGKTANGIVEINNVSIVQLKGNQTVSSLDEFDLCINYYRNDTLFLELFFDKKIFAYPFSELKEEYLDSVKNHKVSLMVRGRKKKYIPAVIEPSSTITPFFRYPKEDKREFRLKPILKESKESECMDISYVFSYLPLYLLGYPTAGNGLFYDGKFFFSEASLLPAKTMEPLVGGKYSVVADYDGKLQLCQMKFDMEKDQIVLRLEDGKTYYYPAALIFPGFREEVEKEIVSACITPTYNWFPVKLYESEYNTAYKPSQLNPESWKLIGWLWKPIKIKNARSYLVSKGMDENMIGHKKLFFTKEEMDNRPPKVAHR